MRHSPLYTISSRLNLGIWTCRNYLRAQSLRWLSTSSEAATEPVPKPGYGKIESSPQDRKTIFSLIQPTGVPHLGNYLGALRRWKEFEQETAVSDPKQRGHYDLYFGLADLHSLTSKQNPQSRYEETRQTFASLMAIGFPHDQLFVQSHVAGPTELMWILSNVASTGYLSRMTQWKDKAGLLRPGQEANSPSFESLDEKSREALKLGLFSYPVLQAADILLYEAHYVPVGEDQAQHVEFTRSLARSFNHMYGKDESEGLRVPELLLSPAKRIMSLQNPIKKMSKSDPDERSRILISDSAEAIRKKFKAAKTDSITESITFDPETRPGVSNLLEIYRHITRSNKSPTEIAQEFNGASLGNLKAAVANAVIEELGPISQRYANIVGSKNGEIEERMFSGYKRAQNRADTVLLKVREAVGLHSRPARN